MPVIWPSLGPPLGSCSQYGHRNPHRRGGMVWIWPYRVRKFFWICFWTSWTSLDYLFDHITTPGTYFGHLKKMFWKVVLRPLKVSDHYHSTQDLHRNRKCNFFFQIQKSYFPCSEFQKNVRNTFFRLFRKFDKKNHGRVMAVYHPPSPPPRGGEGGTDSMTV